MKSPSRAASPSKIDDPATAVPLCRYDLNAIVEACREIKKRFPAHDHGAFSGRVIEFLEQAMKETNAEEVVITRPLSSWSKMTSMFAARSDQVRRILKGTSYRLCAAISQADIFPRTQEEEVELADIASKSFD